MAYITNEPLAVWAGGARIADATRSTFEWSRLRFPSFRRCDIPSLHSSLEDDGAVLVGNGCPVLFGKRLVDEF
ncbi:hypothetical protein, partial [Crossiella cryophila]|uniref:hypothetical protein n=1 Tax=Crossiella cryophila TaxID=43355 RepID=UPI0031E64510